MTSNAASGLSRGDCFRINQACWRVNHYFMNAESASSPAFISGKARPELACASEPNVVVGLLMQGLKVGCHVGPM